MTTTDGENLVAQLTTKLRVEQAERRSVEGRHALSGDRRGKGVAVVAGVVPRQVIQVGRKRRSGGGRQREKRSHKDLGGHLHGIKGTGVGAVQFQIQKRIGELLPSCNVTSTLVGLMSRWIMPF